MRSQRHLANNEIIKKDYKAVQLNLKTVNILFNTFVNWQLPGIFQNTPMGALGCLMHIQ
jgi:hypothetical protein